MGTPLPPPRLLRCAVRSGGEGQVERGMEALWVHLSRRRASSGVPSGQVGRGRWRGAGKLCGYTSPAAAPPQVCRPVRWGGAGGEGQGSSVGTPLPPPRLLRCVVRSGGEGQVREVGEGIDFCGRRRAVDRHATLKLNLAVYYAPPAARRAGRRLPVSNATPMSALPGSSLLYPPKSRDSVGLMWETGGTSS